MLSAQGVHSTQSSLWVGVMLPDKILPAEIGARLPEGIEAQLPLDQDNGALCGGIGGNSGAVAHDGKGEFQDEEESMD